MQLNKLQKHTSNQNYFDDIDTEEKAYILGFLYADGYNSESDYYIKIEIQERDIDILQKIIIALETSSDIKFRKRKTLTSQNTLILKICGKHLSKRLAELGCFQNKSLRLKFPTEEQVPSKLLKHFIRGYFDGDGHIGYRKKQCHCSLLSSNDFCKSLSEYIKLEIKSESKLKILTNSITTRMTFGGSKKNFKIVNWLYSYSTISLNRKFTLYNDIKKLFYI